MKIFLRASALIFLAYLLFLSCSTNLNNNGNSSDYFPIYVGHKAKYVKYNSLRINTYWSSLSIIDSCYIALSDTIYRSVTTFYQLDTTFLTEQIISKGNDIFGLSNDSVLYKFAQHHYTNGDRWVSSLNPFAIDTFEVIYDSCFAVIKKRQGLSDTFFYAPNTGMVRRVQFILLGNSVEELTLL